MTKNIGLGQKKKGPIINRTWEKGQTGKAQKMFYVMPKW